ncbi:MAG: hypothetical protein IIB68_09870 [Proteobacteria bacterium]|nr:hypothetical protein [Pseudomonadota bacterium]
MSKKSIQAAFDEIAAHLKKNGSNIGAQEAYGHAQDLIRLLNRQGFEIDSPVDFNADITPTLRPGFKDLAEQQSTQGSRRR